MELDTSEELFLSSSIQLKIVWPLLELGTRERAPRLEKSRTVRGVNPQCSEAVLFRSWELSYPLLLSESPLVAAA